MFVRFVPSMMLKVGAFLLLVSILCLKASCALTTKKSWLFRCDDGIQLVLSAWFCNGKKECKDGSDELHGDPFGEEIVCQSPSTNNQCLISQKHQCDGRVDCLYGVDECFCINGTARSAEESHINDECFRCLKHTHVVIPIRKLCDGKIDCPDLSDECLCTKSLNRPKICEIWAKWRRNDFTRNFDISEVLTCPISKLQISWDEVCNRRNDCLSCIDEESCGDFLLQFRNGTKKSNDYKCHNLMNMKNTSEFATQCDGKPTCDIDIHGEECDNCLNPPDFCSWRNQGFRLLCPGSKNKILGHQICNAKVDCDNTTADEMNCPGKYYCNGQSPLHIPLEKFCNQEKDCDDESDEPRNCTFSCTDDHNKRIPAYQVCDGIQDCKNASDECVPGCISNFSKYSNEESMIRNEAILAISFIISSVAVVGNVAMAAMSIRQMCRKKKSTRAQRITKLLFLSLSFADLLVAAYTFRICILASTVFHQHYCRHDHIWRSSGECKFLGALFLAGSEQSVFTMILIAFVRAKGFLRPFSSPPLKQITICLAISWIMSILFATVPLIPQFEDTFVDKIWYEGSRLFGTINRTEAISISYRLRVLFDNQTLSPNIGQIGSWSMLEHLISKVDPRLQAGRYGFYSTHSVCLPSLFPSKWSGTARWYSLILIMVNFLAFIAMMIAYFVVYRARKSTESSMDASSDDGRQKISTQLQRKVLIILATDFCCWVPICVMGFVQFAGKDMPTEAYLPIAFIVLPINSALNPFLYSVILDHLLNKARKLRAQLHDLCYACAGQKHRREICREIYDTEVNNKTVTERLNLSREPTQVDGTWL